MDIESQEWYSKISEATDELRSEIKRMRDRNSTPLEFGLKVRNDPEIPLIVTARNKMRSASARTINQSLSGAVVETPYLYNDPKENKINLQLVRELVSDVSVSNVNTKQYGAQDVKASHIIDLLENISIPGSNIRFDPKSIANFIKQYAGNELENWDVVIISGEGSSYNLTDKINTQKSKRGFDLRNDNKFIRMSKGKTRIGGRGDTAWGLSDKEKEAAKEHFRPTTKTLSNEHYFSEEVLELRKRNPLLLIYLVELKDPESTGLEDFGDDPFVGFGIGIPHLSDAETKYIRYQINTIYQALGGFEDEYDEEYDD